jgi:small GTP-binding protein
MITSKICIVGDFAVGKTSVVERFVNNQFSDKYLTTIGVKVDTKEIVLAKKSVSIKLILWDVAGAEKFGSREFAYLRGASGIVYVVDGTRVSTVESVLNLRKQIEDRYGSQPNVLLVNKKDLAGMWQISPQKLESIREHFHHIYETSAKTGDDVELALTELAELIASKDLLR